MNNTTRTLAISAIFIAAILVVEIGTLGVTTTGTTQTAFAFSKKNKGDEQNSKNGSTITIQKCKQAATQSGWDNQQEQECGNLICTHPGNNATCTQEGATISPPTTSTPEPITTTLRIVKKVVCMSTDPNCSLPVVCNILFDILSPGTSEQTFPCQSAVGNGILLTLQPGEQFFVGFFEMRDPGGHFFITERSSDCSGTIAEGQHLTCTLTNTEVP